jgi:hypothetical protein
MARPLLGATAAGTNPVARDPPPGRRHGATGPMQARTMTDKAGVPMQACRQPLPRDYDRTVLHRRIRPSAAAATRLDPGDPDVAAARVSSAAGCRSKRSSVLGALGSAGGDACDRRCAAGRVALTRTKATERRRDGSKSGIK